jgi:subtilisin-like proprotein convertase family protein
LEGLPIADFELPPVDHDEGYDQGILYESCGADTEYCDIDTSFLIYSTWEDGQEELFVGTWEYVIDDEFDLPTNTTQAINFTIPTQITNGSLIPGVIWQTVSNIPSGQTIQDIEVALNITGGMNSDLILEVQAPNGVRKTLVNRIGVTQSDVFGQQGAGIDVVFKDSAVSSVQSVGGTGVINGTYKSSDLMSLFGMTDSSDVNGAWRLYTRDVVGGGNGPSTINSWSINLITM